jgi:hypothetical protein
VGGQRARAECQRQPQSSKSADLGRPKGSLAVVCRQCTVGDLLPSFSTGCIAGFSLGLKSGSREMRSSRNADQKRGGRERGPGLSYPGLVPSPPSSTSTTVYGFIPVVFSL